MVVSTVEGAKPILIETLATNEFELQELMKGNPDLLPIEEFGLLGPVLVIGRETTLASGAVDLICLTRGGEILVIEFKTGPQNSDFRHALAQLIDYGAQIWRLKYSEFEKAVAVQFFSSPNCTDTRIKGKHSLYEAAKEIWHDITEEEFSSTKEAVGSQLESGSFWYILAAQRFTPTIQNAIDYMNNIAPGTRFFAVELVKFDGAGLTAYESRTIIKPEPTAIKTKSILDEIRFLEQVDDATYRLALQDFFVVCRGLHYEINWGTVGCSIRMPNPFGPPASVAYLNPPGKSGFSGFTDVTLGVDWCPENTKRFGGEARAQSYIDEIKNLPDVQQLDKPKFPGVRLSPEAFGNVSQRILEIFGDLYSKVNDSTALLGDA